jgi:hypothetical protein
MSRSDFWSQTTIEPAQTHEAEPPEDIHDAHVSLPETDKPYESNGGQDGGKADS